MSHAVSQDLFRSALLNRDPKTSGFEISVGEDLLQPFRTRQVGQTGHHLHGAPSDEDLSLEQGGLGACPNHHPPAVTEQPAEIPTDQNLYAPALGRDQKPLLAAVAEPDADMAVVYSNGD